MKKRNGIFYIAAILVAPLLVACSQSSIPEIPESSEIPAHCPDPDDPRVSYEEGSYGVPDFCALADLACPSGHDTIPIECGCGCIAPERGECPDPDDPLVDYVSQEPSECAEIDWTGCDLGSGMTYIPDECGCGCLCPDPDDPEVHYVEESHLNPGVCAIIDFECPEGQQLFANNCGCGCIGPERGECPDPDDPLVDYVSQEPSECAVIDWTGCNLGAGMTYIPDECGCGCISPPAEECPDPDDPRVHYVDLDPVCAALEMPTFECDPGQRMFESGCGCGCIDDEPGCTGLGELECAALDSCEPCYTGRCDCTCPGSEGCEGGGCEGCPRECFEYSGCVTVL